MEQVLKGLMAQMLIVCVIQLALRRISMVVLHMLLIAAFTTVGFVTAQPLLQAPLPGSGCMAVHQARLPGPRFMLACLSFPAVRPARPPEPKGMALILSLQEASGLTVGLQVRHPGAWLTTASFFLQALLAAQSETVLSHGAGANQL